MPTTQPMSLKDFFKTVTSVFDPSKMSTPGLTPRTNNLPNNGGSYQSPTPNMSVAPNMSVGKATVRTEEKPVVSGGNNNGRVFTGGGTPAPVKTDVPTGGAPAQLDYSKYTNPATGKPYTPQEYAENIAKKVSGGDIPSYAGEAIENRDMSAEELRSKARELSVKRNDLAVGETDPYKVGVKSGIQFTPEQLSAIEKAYAGIFDPALNDVFSKLEAKEKADAAEKARLERIEEAELESRQRLKELAVKHGYDMELKRTPSGDSGVGSSGNDGEFAATVDLVSNMEGSVYGKKAVANQLRSLIDAKDYASAYNQIANSVENYLVGEPKTKYVNARTDYNVMQGMKEAIEKYAEGGGDMGLLKGTEEQIKRKLGIDSGKASALAVQLWREFQTYRNNMTGAAFGASESRDYASVNPKLGSSLDLNLSIIEGAQNQLKNRIVATIEDRVPSAKYIKEYAEGIQPGAKDGGGAGYTLGQVITGADGKKYKITGLSDPNDPDVEPI